MNGFKVVQQIGGEYYSTNRCYHVHYKKDMWIESPIGRLLFFNTSLSSVIQWARYWSDVERKLLYVFDCEVKDAREEDTLLLQNSLMESIIEKFWQKSLNSYPYYYTEAPYGTYSCAKLKLGELIQTIGNEYAQHYKVHLL